MPAVHTKSEASWGEPSSPSAAVDNGTSAWGKPPSSGTGWGENPAEPAGTYGRTNAPAAAPALCKPGTHRVTLNWQGRSGGLVLPLLLFWTFQSQAAFVISFSKLC